jgi:DNA-binding MarR family transcriptional regulator
MTAEDRVPFPEIVGQFLEQWCDQGMGYQAPNQPLCTKFRAFWGRVTHQAASSDLLEAFRAELLHRGYQLLAGKPAYWEGLSLRRKWKKPACSALPAQQRELLLLLAERDLWSISDLARAYKCSLPTASRTIDRLQRQGLVWCVTAPEDRRRVLVRLTARGQELIAPCSQH